MLRSISPHVNKISSIEIKLETKLKKKEQGSAIHDNFIVGNASLSFALKIPTSLAPVHHLLI